MPPLSISVILPVYNEEGNIARTVISVASFLPRVCEDFEVICVDDGSTDKTSDILAGLKTRFPFLKVVRHPKNEGYGAALKSGFKEAGKEFFLLMDSDGQFDISQLSKLLPFIKEYDIVAGVRQKRRDSFYRLILGAVFRAVINFCFRLSLRDVDCGFKLFRSGFIRPIPLTCSSGLIHTEIFLFARKSKSRVREVGVEHLPRIFGYQKTVRKKALFQLLGELKRLWLNRPDISVKT